MDLSMSNSRKPWWGKQYGLTNVQLYGHINAQQQKTLVGQAVWTFQCSGADFWWGKQYGHTGVQNAGGHSGADRLAASMHGHLLGFDGAKVPADGQTLQVSVLGYLWHQCLQVSIKICPHKSHE